MSILAAETRVDDVINCNDGKNTLSRNTKLLIVCWKRSCRKNTPSEFLVFSGTFLNQGLSTVNKKNLLIGSGAIKRLDFGTYLLRPCKLRLLGFRVVTVRKLNCTSPLLT